MRDDCGREADDYRCDVLSIFLRKGNEDNIKVNGRLQRLNGELMSSEEPDNDEKVW